MITLPKNIGDTVTVGTTAHIKKHRANVYCLTDTSNPYRKRWGNAAEITADAEHFVQFGKLPPASGSRW